MNKENLLKMANHIEKVEQAHFDMVCYRTNETKNCNSVACVVGHCVDLVPEESLPREYNGNIAYGPWSVDFTGISGNAWNWCFGSYWAGIDNTPLGAAKRIRYLVENGLPENWEYQMVGKAPLIY